MTENPRHPWPRSWPPFWRGVLHVAIAGGVGNVVLAGGSFLADYRLMSRWGEFTVHCLLVLCAEIAAGLIVVITGRLTRARWRSTLALLAAFCLGTLVAAIPVLLLLAPSVTGYRRIAEALGALIGNGPGGFRLARLVIPPVLALPTFSVIVGLLAALAPSLSRRRLWSVWLAGVLLFWCGITYVIFTVDRQHFLLVGLWFGPTKLCMFLLTVSLLVPFPLAYAVTARMLLIAAEVDRNHIEPESE